jgi:hypothetical protein
MNVSYIAVESRPISVTVSLTKVHVHPNVHPNHDKQDISNRSRSLCFFDSSLPSL